MRILKIVWVLFILLNVYDVIISAVYWYQGNIWNEENFFIRMYYTHAVTVSLLLAVLMVIIIKLLFFTGVYWFTRLFDVLKVGQYKWVSLLPFIAVSAVVDVNNTLIFYGFSPLI